MCHFRLSLCLGTLFATFLSPVSCLSYQATDHTRANPEIVNLAAVLRLKRAGMSDDVIITAIKTANVTSFDTSTQSLIAMKEAGLSEAVVKTILETQAAASTRQRSLDALSRVSPTPAEPARTAQATICSGSQRNPLKPSTLMISYARKDDAFSHRVMQSGASAATGYVMTRTVWAGLARLVIANRLLGGIGVAVVTNAMVEKFLRNPSARVRQFFYVYDSPAPEVDNPVSLLIPDGVLPAGLSNYEPALLKLTVLPNERARLLESRDVKITATKDQLQRDTADFHTFSAQREEVVVQSHREDGGLAVTAPQLLQGHYALVLKEAKTDRYAAPVFEFAVR